MIFIRPIILFSLLAFHSTLHGQSNVSDSIRFFLDTATTKSQVDFYYEMGRNIERTFPDSALTYYLNRIGGAPISVNDLARHVAMSERQLYRKLGESSGLTPANLIKEVRLKYAMELIHKKHFSKVESLAKEVGFESAAYFSKQFYQRFGRKPTDFIK